MLKNKMIESYSIPTSPFPVMRVNKFPSINFHLFPKSFKMLTTKILTATRLRWIFQSPSFRTRSSRDSASCALSFSTSRDSKILVRYRQKMYIYIYINMYIYIYHRSIFTKRYIQCIYVFIYWSRSSLDTHYTYIHIYTMFVLMCVAINATICSVVTKLTCSYHPKHLVFQTCFVGKTLHVKHA